MSTNPHSLVTGNLQPDDISITVSDSNLELTKEIEDRIENIWLEKLSESESRGKQIYNGTSYRLNNWVYSDNKLHLELAVFNFKHRLGLLAMTAGGEIDPNTYDQAGCYVGATVITSDNKYIMVELSGKSMNYNTYDLLGGMAETDVNMSKNGDYLFNSLLKELKEEAGIVHQDIVDKHLRMFYRSTHAHFAFHFMIETNVTKETLEERFTTNDDVDIAGLCFFDEEEYVSKLNSLGPTKELIASTF